MEFPHCPFLPVANLNCSNCPRCLCCSSLISSDFHIHYWSRCFCFVYGVFFIRIILVLNIPFALHSNVVIIVLTLPIIMVLGIFYLPYN